MSDSETSTDGDDRRGYSREVVCAVAEIGGETIPEATALVRNVSETGAMLLTSAPFKLGDLVNVIILLSDEEDGPTITACGEVVRLAELDLSKGGVWSFELGVQFLESLKDNADELRELTERLAHSASSE